MSIAEVRQSVTRADRLLADTGFMDSARALGTEGWAVNMREARRELSEVADLIARRTGRSLYERMGRDLRHLLWRSILLSSYNPSAAPEDQFDTATGLRIMRALGETAPMAQEDLDHCVSELAGRSTGFPVAILRRLALGYRESATTLATLVERRARERGDPAPPRTTAAEAQEYCEVLLPAIRRARAIDFTWEAQHPEMATFAAVAAAIFGVPTDMSGEGLVGDVRGRTSSMIQDAVADATHTAGPLAWMGRLDAARTGFETYGRLTDPRERLRQCVREVATARCRGNEGQAMALVERLRRTEAQMNAWLAWLDRHRDHPDWVPAGGTIGPASPDARRM